MPRKSGCKICGESMPLELCNRGRQGFTERAAWVHKHYKDKHLDIYDLTFSGGKYTRTLEMREKASAKTRSHFQQHPEAHAQNLELLKIMREKKKQLEKDPAWKYNASRGIRAVAQYKHEHGLSQSYKDAVKRSWARYTPEEKQARLCHGMHSLEGKMKAALINQQKCQNPEVQRKMALAQHKKPNKKEVILDGILQAHFPYQWKYVGHGEIWIGNRNPDFIDVNGKKEVVEFLGDWWHGKKRTGLSRSETEEEIVSHYHKYGFACAIVWECKLKDKEFIINKVKEAVANGSRDSTLQS